MKNKLLLFILLFCNAIYAQKPIFVKPKWQKNQKLELVLSKFYNHKSDSVNLFFNYKVQIDLTIKEITKDGYVAELYYSNFENNFNTTDFEPEAFLIEYLQNQKIKVLLSSFGKPIWLYNANEIDTKLAEKFMQLQANSQTQSIGDYGLNLLSKNNFIENHILKPLKVYCISTERAVILNKNNSFFKAHENARAQGVVSFKAHYILKNNEEDASLFDLNFIINYDKNSLAQVAQNLKFSNPNANVVLAMKGQNYNLINLEAGSILQAKDIWNIQFQNYSEKIEYLIDLKK